MLKRLGGRPGGGGGGVKSGGGPKRGDRVKLRGGRVGEEGKEGGVSR